MNAMTPLDPNIDFDPTIDPFTLGGDDIARTIRSAQVQQRIAINDGLEQNPDDAAEAKQLSDLTGTPPAWTLNNLDEERENVRRQTAQQIVLNNPELVAYLQSHPLAASISNDDWANLDKFSRDAGLSAGLLKAMTSTFATPVKVVDAALRAAGQAGDEAFEQEPLGKAPTEIADEMYHGVRGPGWSLATGELSAASLLLRVMNATGAAAVAGASAGGETYLKSLEDQTGAALGAGQFGRELGAMTEWAMMRGDMPLHGEGPAGIKHEDFIRQQAQANSEIAVIRNWFAQGKEPPAGLSATVDAAKGKLNEIMLNLLDRDLANAQADLTKDRSSEMFAQFVKQHFGDSTFTIHGDAVLGLYGDKLPGPGDGLLGWVPNIDAQLAAARDTGEGISVKAADWLANVDPKVARALHDDIRMSPGGITANEAKEPIPPRAVIDDPLPQVRAGAGLEPKFSMGDRKLTLSRADSPSESITGAATVIDGQVFSGPTHAHSMEAAHEAIAPEMDFEQFFDKYKDQIIGDGTKTLFKTSTGRVVNNIEAGEIASKARQLSADDMEDVKEGGLASEQLGLENKQTLKPKLAVEEDDPYAHLRNALGVEETNQIGDDSSTRPSPAIPIPGKKLEGRISLEPTGERLSGTRFHEFNILDENGQSVGEISLGLGTDRSLFVNWVGGQAGLWSNSFGPALIRDLKRQLKELYPDYDYITGFRVSGARANAGATGVAKVKLDADDFDPQSHHDMQEIFEGGWQRYSDSLLTRESEASLAQTELGRVAMEEVQRITGGHSKVVPTTGIYSERAGKYAAGAYMPSREGRPDILLDIMRDDPVGVGRHEAMHFLRGYNFLTDKEWAALESAAMSEGWLARYNIGQRYGHLTHEEQLEEAVVDGFREWAAQAPEIRPKTGIGAVFQKIMDLFDAIKARLGFGADATWEEVFAKVHSGEVAGRGPGAPRVEGAADIRGLEAKFSLEGADNLRAQAVGLRPESFARVMQAAREKDEFDMKAAQARAERDQARRQTKEWKANSADIAKEVSAEIRQRPDIAADLFIGSGELMGKKLQQRYTLRREDFTPEQLAMIPEHYTSKNGLPADQVAGMFGYGSRDELAWALGRVSELRKADNGNRMGRDDFIRQMVKTETERRMEARYGALDDNIMDAATEQALSEPALNLLHEEYMAACLEAGKIGVDREVVKAAARNVINSKTLGQINSFRLMQDMGKHARDAENFLANKDFGKAVVALEKQTLLTYAAKEARLLEKEMARFDKTAKQFSKRVIPSMETEYTNWVHSILMQIGKKVRRTPEDLARAIAAETEGTLKDFVEAKRSMLQVLPIWDKLYDANWKSEYKDLSPPEFRAVRDSIVALIHNGREERKLIKAGDEADRQEIKEQLIENVSRFAATEKNETGGANIVTQTLRSGLASVLQIERVFTRWDNFDKYGVWNQYVLRDMIDGVNQSDAWKKETSKKISALPDIEDMHKNVPNPGLFKAPADYGGRTLTINREGLHAIMLNMGNESNLTKMSKGWGVDPNAIRNWVNTHATAADWDRVQAIWDIFKGLKDRSDTMYLSVSGVPAQRIEAVPFTNRHGSYRGGYYPMIYHPTYEGESRKLMGNVGLLGEGFEGFDRAMPGAGYENDRTGYIAPTALTLDQMPNRIAQMIHNTAVRPAVLNAIKVFKDPQIRAAITTHYGKEYTDMLVPYLRSVANASNNAQKDGLWLAGVSEFMRQNLIGALVLLNPGTVLKHGPTAAGLSVMEVGFRPFADAVHSLFSINDQTNDTNWNFAVSNSLELQRRDRNWQETLYGATGELRAGNKFGKWRQRIMEWGSKPIALSDMMSAVPTWLAQYKKAIEEGATHGDAVYEADRAVRGAHGSTSVTNRPMLTNYVSPWFTSVYNFFNDIFNRQMETLWRAGEIKGLVKSGQHDAAMKVAAGVAVGMFAYSIYPAIVESLVSPQPSDPKDSWGKRAAKSLIYTEGATLPVIREFTNAILDAKDPDVGLLSTEGKAMYEVARDWGKKEPLSPLHAEKMIRDAGMFAGAFTGVPEQVSKEVSAGYGLAQGIEKPKGPWGWLVLGRYGTIRGHSQTFNDYLAGKSMPNR